MSSNSSPEQSAGSSQDRPRPAPVARWGAACAPCATAKAKCLRSNTAPGSKCDRCERLYKNCSDQVHKPRKKRQSKPSRTTQIEERLNRLVTSLRVSGNVPGLSSDIGGNVLRQPNLEANYSTTLPPGHPNFMHQTSPLPSGSQINTGPVEIPASYNCFVPPSCICRTEPGEAPAPPESDDNLLAIYRDEMAPHFPFVIVPHRVTASTLGATRPFLMACIRMVASFRSPRSMRGQMYRLLNHMADHLILRSERSLDLLLGLVVILGWFHHHCIAHAQLNQLVSQAACLIGELGLKHSPIVPERTRLIVMRPSDLPERTNEERRLLLAVWYLSSSVSLDIQKIDPMRYSAYMEQCVRELEDAGELESDMHVISMVRIQRLAERISQIRDNDDWGEGTGVPRAPISAYAASFQAELDKLEAQMPRNLQKNHFLRVQMATARLRLYEPPTIDADLLASLSKSLTSLSSGHNSALDVFYQANAALKAWFETWLAIPVQAFYPCPLPMASQLIFAVVMMSRWAWLAARNSSPPPAEKTVVDPSSGDPNVALAAMEAAINPNTPASASTPSTNAKATPSRDAPVPDMKLPQVLAELKTQLSRQPELMIDVADIFNRVAEQLEAVDAAMAAVSVDSGPWRGNIWTLGATKVRIAQIRQKRWSDTVSKEYEDGEDGDQDDETEEQAGIEEVEMQDNLAAIMPTDGSWYCDSGWGPNFYDIVDPSLFADGMAGTLGDWASAGFEGMGPMDQFGGTQSADHRYI